MNLFILSLIHSEIAQFMVDKHISKIIIEAVQMLCAGKRILNPDDPINDQLYKKTHANHPVSVWCRESKANFVWVLDLIDAMHAEWKYRYNHPESRMHKSYLVALILRENIPDDDCFNKVGLTPFALAMPKEYMCDDPVLSYRNYYRSPEKRHIASWKKRSPPAWFDECE